MAHAVEILKDKDLNASGALCAMNEQGIRAAVLQHAATLDGLMQGRVTDCANETLEHTDPQAVPSTTMFASRKISKRLHQSGKDICTIKDALQELDENRVGSPPCLDRVRSLVREHNLGVQRHAQCLPVPPAHDDLNYVRRGRCAGDWGEWQSQTETVLNQLGKKRRELRDDIRLENIRQAREAFQTEFANNRKRANKKINGDAFSGDISALMGADGTIVDEAKDIQRLATLFYQKLAEPVTNKTGTYENVDSSTFPWSQTGMDEFTIETKVGKEG